MVEALKVMKPAKSSPEETINRLVSITAIFWFIAKLICWKVWLTNRFFPIVPVISFLDNVPSFIHLALYVLSMTGLLSLFFKPSSYLIMCVIVISEVLSCSLDYTRWQPWQYQYLSCFVIVIAFRKNPLYLIKSFILVLVSTYLFSGIHKLNSTFVVNIWGDLILKSYFNIPEEVAGNSWVLRAGYIIPLLEIAGSIALLLPRIKQHAGRVFIAMHTFNLIMFGSFGINHNSVILPWNMCMIFLLSEIFFNADHSSAKINKASPHLYLIYLFWFILPALSTINLWDQNLSSALYTGNSTSLIVCIDTLKNKEGIPLKQFALKSSSVKPCGDNLAVNLTTWSLKELNVPPYPEKRIFSFLKGRLINSYPNSNLFFRMYGPAPGYYRVF
jgi:hypothetical protein